MEASNCSFSPQMLKFAENLRQKIETSMSKVYVGLNSISGQEAMKLSDLLMFG